MGENMYFMKLVGKKCYLSPIDINDAVKFAEWHNDMDIIVNNYYHATAFSLETAIEDYELKSKRHVYSIVDLETDELLGYCDLSDIDNLNQTAKCGICIGNKTYWNNGYGTEALYLLIDYGFRALNLHNIIIDVYEYNKGAIKCYEKIGFKKIGIRREALQRDLKRHDIVFMDLIPNEFYKKE